MKALLQLVPGPPRGAIAVMAALLIGFAAPAALAQRGAPDDGESRGSFADDPGRAPGDNIGIGPDGLPDAGADAKDDEARKKAERRALLRPPGQSLPDDPGARDKLLEKLYAHLAAAKTKEVANRVVLGINRLWTHSGSDTVGLLMSRAQAADKSKQPKKAIKFLNFVVKLAPAYAEGWNQRAYIHFKQNNITRAMGDLRRVLALDPNHYKALEGLGQILREIDEKRAALAVFKALIKVHPFAGGVKDLIDQLTREVEGVAI